MTIVTLIHGGNATVREQAIAALAPARHRAAAIIEGIAGAGLPGDMLASSEQLTVVRIAPGCPCCTGNLMMRVTLHRLLRKNPAQLYLSLANNEHLSAVINFLQEDQYRQRLEIGTPVDCSAAVTGFANTGH